MRRRRSLKNRLLFWLLTPLVLVSGAMTAIESTNARRVANEAYDRVLLGSALAIAERVILDSEGLQVDVPYVALEMLTSAAQDRVFYRVSGPKDQFLTGYEDLPPPPNEIRPLGGNPVFYDATYRGAAIRIGAVSRIVTGPRRSLRFTVMVAETLGGRNALIREMVSGAILRQLALIALAGIILWFGISRGLAPLSRLEQALYRRNPNDLRPIRHEVPREVQHLMGAINNLMERLGHSFEAIQQFTANAAHQLRTPVAAINTQTELALGEKDPAEIQKTLFHLRQTARQAGRLIEQLLSLARSTSGHETNTPVGADLVATARAVTSEMVPNAVARDIDLEFDAPEEPIVVRADPTMMKELLGNLIDNALTYCPSGGRVAVRVAAGQGTAGLEVEDNGPGIPVAERANVFERFYRLPGERASGSGLGLSIVKEIIERYKGSVNITEPASGTGTLVKVCVPLG